MKVSTAELFQKAYGTFAVGAFNVFTMEQVHALFKGAEKAQAPIIVAITPVARRYAQPDMLEAMVNAAGFIYPSVVYAVHLDHGNEEHCLHAVQSGFYNSVMIDASYEPYDRNIDITKSIVTKAHENGVMVEAELGVLSGVEDDKSVTEKEALYTNPEQACDFVNRTHCDSLAVAVGTSHGAYKFSGESRLQLKILAEIRFKLPHFPLVLHGASAVPQDEIVRINQAGGNMNRSAKGTTEEDLQEAIRLGVCKINIATDARLVWTRVHREFFRDQPDKFDPIIPGQHYMDAYSDFVAQKCEMLGSAGKATLF